MVTAKPTRTIIHGDLAAVQQALPTLSLVDIVLALQYEQDHPDEIAYWIRYDESDDDAPL